MCQLMAGKKANSSADIILINLYSNLYCKHAAIQLQYFKYFIIHMYVHPAVMRERERMNE